MQNGKVEFGHEKNCKYVCLDAREEVVFKKLLRRLIDKLMASKRKKVFAMHVTRFDKLSAAFYIPHCNLGH